MLAARRRTARTAGLRTVRRRAGLRCRGLRGLSLWRAGWRCSARCAARGAVAVGTTVGPGGWARCLAGSRSRCSRTGDALTGCPRHDARGRPSGRRARGTLAARLSRRGRRRVPTSWPEPRLRPERARRHDRCRPYGRRRLGGRETGASRLVTGALATDAGAVISCRPSRCRRRASPSAVERRGLRVWRKPIVRTPPCPSPQRGQSCFRLRAPLQARRHGPLPLLSLLRSGRGVAGPVSCGSCSLKGSHRVVMSASPLSGIGPPRWSRGRLASSVRVCPNGTV